MLKPATSGEIDDDVPPEVRAARLGDQERLRVLELSGLLGGVANPVLDRVARLAAGILDVPIALVSLVDDQRQHFAGLAGLGGWAGEARGTTLSHSFCQHVVTRNAALVVTNASSHPLVMDNLALKDLGVVAYAGVPLRTARGETLGALCAIDGSPVEWSESQLRLLEDLAAVAVAEIELRATIETFTRAQTQWAEEADYDALTGLLNRNAFLARLRQHHLRACRSRSPFRLAVVSVDGLRSINARHGLRAGDHALIDMAALLSTVVGEGNVVARMGDHEFAVLLADTIPWSCPDLSAELPAALAAFNAELGREIELRASVGVACWSADTPLTIPAMLRLAEDLMLEQRSRERLAVGSAPASSGLLP